MALTLDQVGKALDSEWPESGRPGFVRSLDSDNWDWKPDVIQYIYNLFTLLASDQGKLGPRPNVGTSLESLRKQLHALFEGENPPLSHETYDRIVKETTDPQTIYDRITQHLLGGVAEVLDQILVSDFEGNHQIRNGVDAIVEVTLRDLLRMMEGNNLMQFLFGQWLPPHILYQNYKPETPFQKEVYTKIGESFKATFPSSSLDEEAHSALYAVLYHLLYLFGLYPGGKPKYNKEEIMEWLKGLGAPMTSEDPEEQMIRSVLGIIFGAFSQLGSPSMTYNHVLRAVIANPWFDLVPYLRVSALD